jgi:hypothetical protein
MGDKSLMTNRVFILLVFATSLYSDLFVNQIEQMVLKIHEKRQGANLEILETTKDPFIRLKKEENIKIFDTPTKSEELKISLHAIMNGKAYINDEWKSIDDVIMGYTLKHIGKRGVVLRNGNQIKKLFFHKKRDNFIMVEGK